MNGEIITTNERLELAEMALSLRESIEQLEFEETPSDFIYRLDTLRYWAGDIKDYVEEILDRLERLDEESE